MTSIKKRDVVFISVDPWQGTRWARKQMLASLLSIRCRKLVYFVEPARSERKWPLVKRVRKNLLLLDLPNPLCRSRFSIVKRVGTSISKAAFKLLTLFFGVRDPIFIAYQPQNVELSKQAARWIGSSLLCYDMTDDWSKFPGQSQARIKSILQAEERALQAVDVVFAVSEVLLQRAKQTNPSVCYLPNATSFENFNAAMGDVEVNQEVLRISSPRLGYVGKITAWRLDFELLKWLAEARPDWSLVLVGPEHPGSFTQNQVLRLKSSPNVHFLGPRNYWELAPLIKGFDVCLLPHSNDSLTESMDPIKLYDYLATGKPVISTSVREAQKFADVIDIADSREHFLSLIEDALSGKLEERQERRVRMARENTWEKRVEEMVAILEESLKHRLHQSRLTRT